MPKSDLLNDLIDLRPDVLDGDPEMLARWTDLEVRSLQWQSRNSAIGGLIAENSSVLDMGCGTMAVKQFLPKGCTYIPADIVKRSADCHVIDLNNDLYPSEDIGPVDYVVFSGVLEYLHDASKALRWAGTRARRIITTYAVLEKNPGIERRTQKSGFFNHYDSHAFRRLLVDQGLHITSEIAWRRQLIFDLDASGI